MPTDGRVVPTRRQPPEQYAVVLVNEDELGRLLRRPAARNVTGWSARDGGPRRVRRAVAAAIVVVAVGAGTWAWTRGPTLAAVFARPAPVVAPPRLETGESFSVALPPMASGDEAAWAAARIETAGLPSFVRIERQAHQVLVGPFASLDEAERAQAGVEALGFDRSGVFVDDSLGGPPPAAAPAVSGGGPRVELVGAPGRVALVLELAGEPRRVSSVRPRDSPLILDVGPVHGPVRPGVWTAPAGVHLVTQVSLEELEADRDTYLRVRVSLPPFARENVRVEGPRVYVDLTWPTTGRAGVPPAPAVQPAHATVARRAGDGTRTRPVPPPPVSASLAEVDSSARLRQQGLDRLEHIGPFLISAVRSASPEVMAALDRTLADLEASVVARPVPAGAVADHALLLSATRSARRALDPSFAGNRLDQARHALGMLQMAKPRPAETPDGGAPAVTVSAR